MKASLLFGFVSLALLPLCAEELKLTVNTPYTETVTDSQTFTIEETAVAANLPPVLTATLTFTYPSVTPDISEVANEKLAIACDPNGQLLVANGTAWWETGLKVDEGEEVLVSATGKFVGSILKFDVTLTAGEETVTETVTAPATGDTLTELTLTGEGSAKNITLAVVNTAILPTPEGESQNADQIADYITWLNDAAKGGAMSDVTDAELADAFAMNVGGTPKLEITAIDTETRTITVKGSYTAGDDTAAVDAPLNAINGILYITWSQTLAGEARVSTENITVAADGTATVKLPENANFVKATVSLVEPDTTEPASL